MSKTLIITVVSIPPSFCRAGMRFSKEPTEIKAADLSEDQIKQLKDEPKLIVTESEVDADNSADQQNQSTDSINDSESKALTAEDLVTTILELNPNDKTLWTNGGKPHAKALSEAVGQEVSAKLRDEAFDLYQKQKDAGND